MAVASADVRGKGYVTFVGESTTIRLDVGGRPDADGNYPWEHVSVTRNSVDDKGVRLGGIRQVAVTGVLRDGDGSSFDVNRIGALVLQKQTPPPENVIANDDYAKVSQRQFGRAVTFNWRQNDVDLDADPLILAGHTQPAHGEVEMRSDGVGTYHPAPGYLGRDSFGYTITDGKGNTDTAAVILDVVDNLPPEPFPRRIEFPHGTPGPIRGVIGYRDPDGDPAVAAVRVARAPGDLTGTEGPFPEHGEVSFTVADGKVEFEYRPVTGELRGRDLVFFTLDDGRPGGVSGTVRLELVAPNAPPAAADQRFAFAHGTAGPVGGSFAVADPDGDAPHSVTLVRDGFYGDATVRVVGGRVEFEYVPHAGDLRGGDSFTYRVSDGFAESVAARVEIAAPNAPPVANDFGTIASTSYDDPRFDFGFFHSVLGPNDSTPVRGNVFQTYFDNDFVSRYAYVSDADGDPLEAALVDGPRYGSLVFDPATGEFTYTPIGRPRPEGGFNPLYGEDTFTYRVYDGHDLSNLATVTIQQWLGSEFAARVRSDAFAIHYDADDEDKILIIRATDLVANDRFDRGVDVAGHFDLVDVHVSFRSLNNRGTFYQYDSDRDEVTRVEFSGAHVLLEPDEYLAFVPSRDLDAGFADSFTYEVLYPLPGFPADVTIDQLSRLPHGTVVVNVTRDPQADTDGVDDETESGDGNGDGTPDDRQAHVASLPNGGDGRYVTLVALPDTPLVDVRAIPNPSPADAPAVEFPLGFLSFKVAGVERGAGAPPHTGARAMVTILPPPGVVVNTYYKYGKTADDPATAGIDESFLPPHWYEFLYDGTTGAEFFDDDADGDTDRVVLHLQDAGRGDTDGFGDGVISDPGGPAFRGLPAVPPTAPPMEPGRPFVGPREFAAGAGRGAGAVTLYGPDGAARFTLDPFGPFTGGVRTAAADFNGDGVADVVAGTGPGRATRVVILDGRTQAELFAVDPFEAGFIGGVYVAAGDVTGDGVPDLVITPDEGGGPRVRVFDGKTFAVLADFFGIDDPNFRGGARASCRGRERGRAPATWWWRPGSGRAAGRRRSMARRSSAGRSPRKLFGDFFAFEETLRNGVFVAAGDLDGDGFAEVIAGGGPGGGPRVTAFSGKQLLANQYDVRANFFGGDPDNRGGVRVAVKDLDGDTRADLVVGAGEGAGSRVTGLPRGEHRPGRHPAGGVRLRRLPRVRRRGVRRLRPQPPAPTRPGRATPPGHFLPSGSRPMSAGRGSPSAGSISSRRVAGSTPFRNRPTDPSAMRRVEPAVEQPAQGRHRLPVERQVVRLGPDDRPRPPRPPAGCCSCRPGTTRRTGPRA